MRGRGERRSSEYVPIDTTGLGPRLKGKLVVWNVKGFGSVTRVGSGLISVRSSGLRPELNGSGASLLNSDVSFYVMNVNGKEQAVDVCEWYEDPLPKVVRDVEERKKLAAKLFPIKLQEIQRAATKAKTAKREMLFGTKKPRKRLTPMEKSKMNRLRCEECERMVETQRSVCKFSFDSVLKQDQVALLNRRRRVFDEKVGRFILMDANGRTLRVKGAPNMWFYEEGIAKCDMCGRLRPADRVVGCSQCSYDLCLPCFRSVTKPRPASPDTKAASFYELLREPEPKIQPKEGHSRKGRTCWQEEEMRKHEREKKVRGRLLICK